MTILLVDDSAIVRLLLKNVLEKNLAAETIILEAANGHIAMEIMNTKPVDVVFLDWNMPIMNGEEVVTAIRSNTNFRNTRIIMATTEGAKEDVLKMIKKGVNGYLVKPFREAAILSAFQKATGRMR